MFKAYYQLTKPGIIYGNAITAAAGFFLAAKNHINPWLLLAALIGLSLVIGGSCVLNNIYDSEIDASMERTKERAIASGKVSKRTACIYGTVLLALGIFILYRFTTTWALIAALAGFVVYVFIYTPLKHKTVHATLVGSVAGATPPVVGYCAVINRFDLAALLLFLILVFWQMPHFYAIAVRRIKDYQAANIPVLPIKSGVKIAKIQTVLYIIGFIAAALLLAYFGYAKYTYVGVVLILGLWWLWQAIKGFKAQDDSAWAKKVFLTSLMVLTVMSVTMYFTAILP